MGKKHAASKFSPLYTANMNLQKAYARINELETTLERIANYAEAHWREGEKEYQFAIISRDALGSQSDAAGDANRG